jgi:N-acetylglucosamine-6-phosphate deacetylase
MSPLASRAPGVVGAALDHAPAWCGVIADGHHVHDAALRIAYRAKGADKLVLVTDAMPPVGTAVAQFTLAGRRISAVEGRCIADDGTLAGSVLNMAAAVRHAALAFGIDFAVAARMASSSPASAIQRHTDVGRISPGMRASMVLVDAGGHVLDTWIDGVGMSHPR